MADAYAVWPDVTCVQLMNLHPIGEELLQTTLFLHSYSAIYIELIGVYESDIIDLFKIFGPSADVLLPAHFSLWLQEKR